MLTTNEFAKIAKVKPQSIRHSLCTRGHYLKVRPVKLENRRLMWREKDVEEAIDGTSD